MSKYLIINADDFGYNDEQNRAIKELFSKGLITSTSVMSVASCASDAVEFAAEKNISVGVHLTLNSDEKSEPWHGLAKTKSFAGGLPTEQKELFFGAKRKDVAAELEAQYRFVIDRGGMVDHADNHCGTLYGINGRRFFLDAFEFCRRHSLPFRFPKSSGFVERQFGRPLPALLEKYRRAIVAAGEKRGIAMLDDLVSNPWPMKRIRDFGTLEKYYLDAVDSCIEGVTEIFMHPAYPKDDVTGEWQKRVFELEILKSGCLIEHAKRAGVILTSWQILRDINRPSS